MNKTSCLFRITFPL